MSGEWSTTTNLISGLASTWSKLYDPILGSLARPTPGMPPMGPPDSINPNKATLASSLQQQTAALTPTELTGMSLNWQTSIGQRMMRTHSFKWVGQGNPMMGKPGSGLETQLQWTGGAHTAQGPSIQAVFGPFNLNSLLTKGKMDTQIVKVGENSMHVFVNSWDINQWAVFMAINQFSTKLGRNNHFKFKSQVQCPGGLIDGLRKGQSMGEFELAYCPAMLPLKRFDVSIGAKWGAEIGLTLDHLTRFPLSILGADPFIVFKHNYPPLENDKSLDSTNTLAFQYSRQTQKLTMDLISTPTTNMDQMVAMNIKSAGFLQGIPKEARQESFEWARSERNSYRVKGVMDFKSKMFSYAFASNVKWVERGSEFTFEVKADPGKYWPHKVTAALSENLWIAKQNGTTPLTTDISLSYDSATPERPPRMGIGFNLQM